MNPLTNIPPVKNIEEDPVARSMAKPEPFAKPGSIGKAGAPTNKSPTTRVRTLGWKRGRGRPRKSAPDPRNVAFF